MTMSNGTAAHDDSESPRARRTRAPRARSPRQLADSARNRAEIVDAAVQVFGERGYAATTLDAVAQRVGLTRPGVLHHFLSKDALFAAVITAQEQWARDRFRQQPLPSDGGSSSLRDLHHFVGRDADTRVRLQLVQFLQTEAVSGHPAARAFAEERLRRIRQQITAQLEHARAAGELRPGVDIAATTTLLTAAVNGLQAQLLLDQSIDTAAAIEQLLCLVLVEPQGGTTAAPDDTQPR